MHKKSAGSRQRTAGRWRRSTARRPLSAARQETHMALRPLRNATISFGLVNIPVRFYTATKSEDVSFNLLHESCGSRVNRKWWCPHHEEMIETGDMIRAYAIAKNQYVTFTDEEIDADRKSTRLNSSH